ncbi:hypothetical protein BGY98DRAFT_160800 [Russula aff. rugulosa BPL654]|nr:hypothetical protein BGY98DRAFT_160800 [Russula aff. rugulosa BPL654]
MGSIVSAIGYGLNSIISAIATVLETIIGAIVAVRTIVDESSASHLNLLSQIIVAIFNVITDVLAVAAAEDAAAAVLVARARDAEVSFVGEEDITTTRSIRTDVVAVGEATRCKVH